MNLNESKTLQCLLISLVYFKESGQIPINLTESKTLVVL